MLLSPLLVAIAGSAMAAKACALRRIENLVTFGDSYTDESRLQYFFDHHGHAPPPGVLLPPSNQTSSGGKLWGRFVAEWTGVKYYNYAVAGSMCSDRITSHYFDNVTGTFPSLREYQLLAYKADTAFKDLYPDRMADNTVYALWIGTNDLGIAGFLSDSNVRGTDISTFVDCAFETFDTVYNTGGRQFVLFNQAPLHISPMYAAPADGGTTVNQYCGNSCTYNMTEYEYKIFEYTTSVNTMFEYGAAFHLIIKKRWPGAAFTIYNVYDLILDIYANPTQYLTVPANVTGPYHTCDENGCLDSKNALSSFLWYDALHPAERTDEVIARHFIDVINGNSKYATYYK